MSNTNSVLRLLVLALLCALALASTMPVSKRQANRESIIKRSRTKAVLAEIRARSPTAVRRAGSATSPAPVPACNAGLQTGYAHYANWDLPGRGGTSEPVDIQQTTATSEADCQAKCDAATGANGATCVGIFWWPANNGFCSLKNSKYTYMASDFQQNGASAASGSATDMLGSCAYWRQFVPAAMDAVCCQS